MGFFPSRIGFMPNKYLKGGGVAPAAFSQLPAGSVFLDLDASLGVTQSSNAVSQWASQTGTGSFTQSTANLKPTYEATGWDGTLPQITADGIDTSGGDIMTSSDVVKKDTYYELIVAKRSGASFVGGTGGVSSTTLTVTSMTAGKIVNGLPINGTGVTGTPKITGQLTGTTGGAGTYTMNAAQTIADGTALLIGQNAVAVGKPITESPRLTGDLVIVTGQMLRVANDATQDDVQISGTGNTAAGTLTNSAFSAGAKTLLTSTINKGTNGIRVNSGTSGGGSTVSTTTAAIHSLFGSQTHASARAAVSLARLLRIDFSVLPGGIEQDANRFWCEAILAWKYGMVSQWAANHAGHPFTTRAPNALDYSGNNRLFQVWGDSLAAGAGGQLGAAINGSVLGITAQSGGVGGEYSYMTWWRLINGYDNGGAWGNPFTTGKTTTQQAVKINIIGDIVTNDGSISYPLGTSASTTPETGVSSGTTPSPYVGSTWGNLYDMVKTLESRQGVGTGQGRIILWPFWEGNGASGSPNAASRAANNTLASDPNYSAYALNMNIELWKLGAPGMPYADATAYSQGVVPSALRAGGSTHLNTTGYLEAANILSAVALAKRWSN